MVETSLRQAIVWLVAPVGLGTSFFTLQVRLAFLHGAKEIAIGKPAGRRQILHEKDLELVAYACGLF